MKIKYNIFYNELDYKFKNYSSYIDDEGELEVDNFNGYELFCKMYKKMEGESSVCGVSKEEFDMAYQVVGMGDWLLIRLRDGNEYMNFVRID
jgi:hypothetical protein